MSIKASVWAWSQTTSKPTSKFLLVAMAEHADDEGQCWPSTDLLAERCLLKRRYTTYLLRELEAEGFIKIEKRAVKGRQSSNKYTLNLSSIGLNTHPVKQVEGCTTVHPKQIEGCIPVHPKHVEGCTPVHPKQEAMSENSDLGMHPSAGGGCTPVHPNRNRTINIKTNVNTLVSRSKEKIDPVTIDETQTQKPAADKKKQKRPAKQFVKPSLEQVTVYCLERNKGIDPEQWIDHYTSNGWRVGRNPMKDWKAAVRTWERRNEANQRPHQARQKYQSTRETISDAIEDRANAAAAEILDGFTVQKTQGDIRQPVDQSVPYLERSGYGHR